MTYDDKGPPPGGSCAHDVRMGQAQEERFDLLYGAPAIAAHMGMKEPQVRHLIANGTLPTFKIGKRLCARRSTLNTWNADTEAKALAEREAVLRGGRAE